MILGGPDKTYENLKKAVSNSVESIEDKSTDKKESSTTNNNKLADDFTLVDQYGTIHKLSDYKGKVVFLNFWATWCPPCRGEMPDIEAIIVPIGGGGLISGIGYAIKSLKPECKIYEIGRASCRERV